MGSGDANPEDRQRNCCPTHNAAPRTCTASLFCSGISRGHPQPHLLGGHKLRRGGGDLLVYQGVFTPEPQSLIAIDQPAFARLTTRSETDQGSIPTSVWRRFIRKLFAAFSKVAESGGDGGGGMLQRYRPSSMWIVDLRGSARQLRAGFCGNSRTSWWCYGLRRTFSILLYCKIATGLGKLTTGTGRRPAAEGVRHGISKSLDSRRTLR
jgi:hypothetical protein